MVKRAHCFFEQSGTFKKEFISLGIPSFDYDILNDFGQTDFVCDLFKETDKALNGLPSVFDFITPDDLIFAFFPCTRFSQWIKKHCACTCHPQNSWDPDKKLEYSMRIESERSNMYQHLCRFVLVCLRKNIPLIIENPFHPDSYLYQYFPFQPSVVDLDRRRRGDSFVKPTQYFFFNCEPKYNFIFEAVYYPKQKHCNELGQVERSMITPQYANRFIREFILDSGRPEGR